MADDGSNDAVTLERRQTIIREQACFKGLTDEEVYNLAKLLKEQRNVKEDDIVKEGDIIDSVYFIVEGEAEVCHITYMNGVREKKYVATLKAGNTIGLNDRGFYSLTGRRTATVIALMPMLLLKLTLAVFHGFALVNPHVNKVMREHASRMLLMR